MSDDRYERKSRFETMNEERRAGLVDEDHLRFLSSLGDIDARRLFPDVEPIKLMNDQERSQALENINEKQKALFSIAIAEKSMPFFNVVYNKDLRIQRAFNYAKWSLDPDTEDLEKLSIYLSSALDFLQENQQVRFHYVGNSIGTHWQYMVNDQKFHNGMDKKHDLQSLNIADNSARASMFAISCVVNMHVSEYSEKYVSCLYSVNWNKHRGFGGINMEDTDQCISECIKNARECTPEVSEKFLKKTFLDLFLENKRP